MKFKKKKLHYSYYYVVMEKSWVRENNFIRSVKCCQNLPNQITSIDGAHFTNDFSLTKQIWWKKLLLSRLNGMIFQNFAHIMIGMLWYAPKMWRFDGKELDYSQMLFTSKLNCVGKIISKMSPCSLSTPLYSFSRNYVTNVHMTSRSIISGNRLPWQRNGLHHSMHHPITLQQKSCHDG